MVMAMPAVVSLFKLFILSPWRCARGGRYHVKRRTSSMAEKRMDKSRRNVIGAVAGSVAAGILLRVSPTAASEKMTRQQAQYQDMPNGIYSCAVCTLFEPPAACKVVDGEVSKDGWCKAFALAD